VQVGIVLRFAEILCVTQGPREGRAAEAHEPQTSKMKCAMMPKVFIVIAGIF